jgi:formylglycine-generating enzyme required for sulfatase activity
MEVIVRENHIVIMVNGKITSEYFDEQRRYAGGHIALQQHDPQSVVEFRKIEIKELNVASRGAGDASSGAVGSPAASPTVESPTQALVVKPPVPPAVKRRSATKKGRGAVPNPIVDSIGMKLVPIPAGEFLMGSPDTDNQASGDEKPQHWVRITRPFYLGAHEVTQGQYRAVVGTNPSKFRGSDDLPVETVSWNDAIEFCNKLSEREGLKPCYSTGGVPQSGGSGYRLPTEAEWEYACRAGSTTIFSYGDDYASLDKVAWFKGSSGGKTHPVGHLLPNAWGLYDMHGNVREWCWDRYADNYFGQSPFEDPLGPSQGVGRVTRGGLWDYDPRDCRTAERDGDTPDRVGFALGFRVARVLSIR